MTACYVIVLYSSDPSRENSQSSTDTATSAESTPQSSQTPELKVKQEPLDSLENGKIALKYHKTSTFSGIENFLKLSYFCILHQALFL